MFTPTAGSITLDGTEIVGLAPHRITHLGVARTLQIPRPFMSMTVRDNITVAIMFGREPMGLDASREAAGEYLALVGLTGLADAFPAEVNLHERQLLEMPRAMATRPAVLVEQNVKRALEVSSRAYLPAEGRTSWRAKPPSWRGTRRSAAPSWECEAAGATLPGQRNLDGFRGYPVE